MRDLTATEQSRMIAVLTPAQQAVITWFTILWQPSVVTMTKPRVVTKTTTTAETALAPQTIRIDGDSKADLVQAVAGAAPIWQAEITGVKDHPTVAETDIGEGYTFALEGNRYRVTEVWRLPGKIRALAMVNG